MDFHINDCGNFPVFDEYLFLKLQRSLEYEFEISGTNYTDWRFADDYFLGNVDFLFREN